MLCHTFLACLLACLAYVSAFPPSLLAYTEESGEPTLLDCTETNGATYRCQLVKRGDISQYNHKRGEEKEEEEDEAAQEITEENEISQVSPEDSKPSVDSSFVVSFPGQNEALRVPKCRVYEIYVPELNECVDVIEHLNAPELKDPRVAKWYIWRNAIIEARRRARGF